MSVPFGENHRYDLIIEKNNVLSRVQVKTGRLRKGVVVFNCYSSHAHRGGAATRMYTGEVEYFAVYCPDTECTYLLPLSEMTVQQGMLRIEPPLNNQVKGLRWAREFVLGRGPCAALVEVGTITPFEVPAPGTAEPS